MHKSLCRSRIAPCFLGSLRSAIGALWRTSCWSTNCQYSHSVAVLSIVGTRLSMIKRINCVPIICSLNYRCLTAELIFLPASKMPAKNESVRTHSATGSLSSGDTVSPTAGIRQRQEHRLHKKICFSWVRNKATFPHDSHSGSLKLQNCFVTLNLLFLIFLFWIFTHIEQPNQNC